MSTDKTTPLPVDDTRETDLLEEVFPTEDTRAEEPLDHSGEALADSATAPEQPQGTQDTVSGATPTPVEPVYLKGAAPTPIIIGLIGLLTLAGCAVWSLTDWSVNWAVAAPVGIVLLGVVIIVLGVAGLRRPRS